MIRSDIFRYRIGLCSNLFSGKKQSSKSYHLFFEILELLFRLIFFIFLHLKLLYLPPDQFSETDRCSRLSTRFLCPIPRRMCSPLGHQLVHRFWKLFSELFMPYPNGNAFVLSSCGIEALIAKEGNAHEWHSRIKGLQ